MTHEQHYFTSEPRVTSHPVQVALRLPDVQLDLLSDRGVFARGRLDAGTELLLRSVPPPPASGDVLDLGCGYGAIALTIAVRAPALRVWALDVNQRALALTARNAENARAHGVVAVQPDDVPPDVHFSAIYSNPPVRIGKAALHTLLSGWLRRLLPDAHAYLVIQRHLGADSLAEWLSTQGYDVTRLRSRSGYRLLDVRSRRDTSDD